MNKLKTFLEESYNSFNKWKTLKEIHIVLGNESCDLDSAICSLAYSYFLSQKLNFNEPNNIAVFPVLNVSAEDFPLRTVHCSLLKNIGINLEKLLYRPDFEELIKEKKDSIRTYLVDHHVLRENDQLLEDTVCKIFDHRPVNQNTKWSSKVQIRIEPVGSCATLIADEILKEDGMMFKELAYLLYCTIVYDTLAVRPEHKKATPLDVSTAEKLEDIFSFTETRLALFQKIQDLHGDVAHLTTKQLLIRDLKFVDNIPIPGLPMLVETFLKLPEVKNSLKDMCVKNKAPFIVLIGLETKPIVKRDIALFFLVDKIKLKESLVNLFKENREFKFEELPCELKNVVLLRQCNIEKSRKQIMPIVQHYLKES